MARRSHFADGESEMTIFKLLITLWACSFALAATISTTGANDIRCLSLACLWRIVDFGRNRFRNGVL